MTAFGLRAFCLRMTAFSMMAFCPRMTAFGLRAFCLRMTNEVFLRLKPFRLSLTTFGLRSVDVLK